MAQLNFNWSVFHQGCVNLDSPAGLPSHPPQRPCGGPCASLWHTANTHTAGRCGSTGAAACRAAGTASLLASPWPGSACGLSCGSAPRGLSGGPRSKTPSTRGRISQLCSSSPCKRCISLRPVWWLEPHFSGTFPLLQLEPCSCSAKVWGWTPACTEGSCNGLSAWLCSSSLRCSPDSSCAHRGWWRGPAKPPGTPNNRTGPVPQKLSWLPLPDRWSLNRNRTETGGAAGVVITATQVSPVSTHSFQSQRAN